MKELSQTNHCEEILRQISHLSMNKPNMRSTKLKLGCNSKYLIYIFFAQGHTLKIHWLLRLYEHFM